MLCLQKLSRSESGDGQEYRCDKDFHITWTHEYFGTDAYVGWVRPWWGLFGTPSVRTYVQT